MELTVNPDVLVWARAEAGLDAAEAAEELGLELAELQALETGDTKPTLTTLRRMSKKYGRPLAAFGMPEPPAPAPMPEDFRTIGGTAPRLSPETRRVIRGMQSQQDYATELITEIPDLAHRFVVPRINLSANASVFAENERSRFQITFQEQLAWRTASEAFRTWRRRVEESGVLVFLAKMRREDCRGFSLWRDETQVPTIVINSQEVDAARNFTLLHEHAHIALRRTGICLERDRGVDGASIERFCNVFAATVLMPEVLVREVVVQVNGRVERRAWDTPVLTRMARVLSVSGLALALRLEELQLAPRGYYAAIVREREGEAWERRGWGRADYAAKQLNRLGTHYVGVVLGALDQGAITRVDAAGMLNTSARHFATLGRLLTPPMTSERG